MKSLLEKHEITYIDEKRDLSKFLDKELKYWIDGNGWIQNSIFVGQNRVSETVLFEPDRVERGKQYWVFYRSDE